MANGKTNEVGGLTFKELDGQTTNIIQDGSILRRWTGKYLIDLVLTSGSDGHSGRAGYLTNAVGTASCEGVARGAPLI